MYSSFKTSQDYSRAIMLRSHHPRNKQRLKPSKPSKRSESVIGTKNYRDALQRAFNKAKEQIFFNPDMNLFITLTYKGVSHSPEDVLRDIKLLVKKERFLRSKNSNPAGSGRGRELKYLYIMEYQKRGSIHVHMIANDFFTLQVNKNGYRELVHWRKGFSSVLSIQDFDNNFRPYLYLFKYMKKSQRIGKSFVHTSRNLNNYIDITHMSPNLLDWDTINMEYTSTTLGNKKISYYRNFLIRCDTMNTQ